MKDKKVGKLWSKLKSDCNKGDECDNHGETFQLIRKLVGERADKYAARNRFGNWLSQALSDFGIDPATWK